MLQFPAATVALQLCVPSLTVTVPVGVPLPGAVAATVNVKLAGWPTAEGFGDWPVMAVVGAAAFTLWGVPADALVAKLASPGEGAASVVGPAGGGGRGELAAAT